MTKPHSGWYALAATMLFAVAAASQTPSPQAVRNAVRDYRQQHEVEIVRSYTDLLSLPDVASDTANIHANAQQISGLLQKRRF